MPCRSRNNLCSGFDWDVDLERKKKSLPVTVRDRTFYLWEWAFRCILIECQALLGLGQSSAMLVIMFNDVSFDSKLLKTKKVTDLCVCVCVYKLTIKAPPSRKPKSLRAPSRKSLRCIRDEMQMLCWVNLLMCPDVKVKTSMMQTDGQMKNFSMSAPIFSGLSQPSMRGFGLWRKKHTKWRV